MARRFRTVQGEIYFPIIIGIHLLFWVVDLLIYQGPLTLSEGESPIQRVIGEVLSSWVITVFGFNLLMATRARWVERIFGGLDKMYVIHRRAGAIGMVLLLLHFAIVPRHPEFTVGKPLGFAAMVLIFIGVVLSVAPYFKRKIPYSKWLNIHRFMGPFFLLGVVHAYTVPTLISHLPFTRNYVLLMSLMGVISWVYTVFFQRVAHPTLRYEVTEVKKYGGSMLGMEMVPMSGGLDFQAGQFAFFSFKGLNPRESHPFTIACHPSQGRLRLAVKAEGDFTAAIQNRMQAGEEVEVEGPYGGFTQLKSSGVPQIWVAGGVGITPFLAMAHDLKDDPREVVLYWTIPTRDEAFFDAELQSLSEQIPSFQYKLWLSNDKGRLSLDGIEEARDTRDVEVFICGPEALRDSLTDGLRAQGVPSAGIHSEEFMFR